MHKPNLEQKGIQETPTSPPSEEREGSQPVPTIREDVEDCECDSIISETSKRARSSTDSEPKPLDKKSKKRKDSPSNTNSSSDTDSSTSTAISHNENIVN